VHRIWQERKRVNERIVRDFARRSPVMACLRCVDLGLEWRTVVAFNTKTLVNEGNDSIRRAGPVLVGIRYLERYLSEAPDPMEIATVLRPHGVFHPNCSSAGAICLGHPTPGISMELILHQLWSGLTFNMKTVNTRPGQVVNPEAAVYVRASAGQFPITTKGLFEEPDGELLSNEWHVRFDPRIHGGQSGMLFDQPGDGNP
jgi:hypothetical protein